MTYFYAEVTDTFGGEANYSWVRRYKVKATTFTGAIRKVPCPGTHWRVEMHCGDMSRYKASGAAVCCFVEDWDEQRHGNLQRVEDI